MRRWLGVMCLTGLTAVVLVSVGQTGWTNDASNGETELSSTAVTRPLDFNGATPTPTSAPTQVPTPNPTPNPTPTG